MFIRKFDPTSESINSRKMSTFKEKLNAQLEREATIVRVHRNFMKENRWRLKIVTRLQEWNVRIIGLWAEFRTAHDELATFENILTKLGKPIVTNVNSIEMSSPKPIGDSVVDEEESENKGESTAQDSTEAVVNDDLKTPRCGVDEPFPNYIMRYPDLRTTAEETLGRFQNKMRRFANELDNVEKYLADGLLLKAQLIMKDIEKRRVDLDENIDGITFMLGD